MRDVSAPRLRNKARSDYALIQQSQNHAKAATLPSASGKRDISMLTPVDDGAGNTGYMDEILTNTATANTPGVETNPNALAMKAKIWMVSTTGNRAAEVEFVAVERSDGQWRHVPTVAF